MTRTFFLSLAILLPTAASAFEGPRVALGVARVDITPDEPIRLSGYAARSTESRGVGQKIWAKALAIGTDAQGPALLVSVDNLGVPEAITAEVAARLKRRAGIARERLAISSSHTHSAPCLTNVAPNIFGRPIPPDQQAKIDRYTHHLVDKLESVCLAALKDRTPGHLAWARGSAAFAANRRTPGGPVDHSLPVLKATAPDGTLRAVVIDYACHCTTVPPNDNVVSGDWAGFAQLAIEADHPGCIAMTVIGCGADANPNKRLAPGAAESHGRAIADEVNRLLRGSWTALSAPPEASLERVALPFDTLPTRAELERLVKAGGAPGYNASTFLARLDRGEPLPKELPYSAQAWRFGDALLMVFLPGEVVVDYALRIKREFDADRLWITAYANDVPCYIPSERILREGGYEGGGAMVYYGWPTRLKPGIEQRILDAVHRAVGPHFAPPAPQADRDEMPPPKSPEESARAFRVKPGLKLEVVAAEPLIESPVAIDFGADGKLWVCEMRDYPTGLDGNGKPGGAIKVLEDRDRDGRYESATVFIDGLPFPTGVMAWRKGVLICAAPEILYAEDTNGDGKADVRKTLFRGFSTENFQARVNGLSYNLDNWIYGANGLIGGTIHGTMSGREVNIGGRDFRMKPDTGAFEPASGLTQQGRVHDDWGNQFGGNNSVLIQHYPLPDHAVKRNPRVAAPAPAVLLARDQEPSQLFPASRTLARYNHPESANHVTSACSPLIYRDTLLGARYAGNAFTCEPVHNLVRRLVLEPDSVTFAGHRAVDEQTSEFLASTDSWSRPVQVRTGPDGALWIVDMYRFVIEHPRWISPERLETLDVRAGADKGRIYRLVPEGTPIRPVQRLDVLSTRDLAAALDSPNGTVRDNVQRLLVERGDRAAVPVLAELARASTHPECRAQALGALDGIAALEPAHLRQALEDAHPGVRRQAVRLSEPWLDKDPEIARRVLALADAPEITVRFQVALSLGESAAPEAGRALGRIALRDGSDSWVRAAVLSSCSSHAGVVLEMLIARAGTQGPAPSLIEPLISTIAGSRGRQSIARALAVIGTDKAKPEPWRLGAVAELLDAAHDQALVEAPAVRPLIDVARSQAADRTAQPGNRITALRLLGRSGKERNADRATIADRLDPAEPIELQRAAVGALARLDDQGSVEAIVSHWPRLGPSIRSAALDALLARPGSTERVLAALEQNRLAPSEVDAAHRERLLANGSEAIRGRASRVFGNLGIGSRQAVLKRFEAVRTLPGDPERGKVVFARICAACHRLNGIGHEVGPDLAALTDTSPEALLTAILDPNREVDARYASYTAALKDGRVLNGLIAAETASAITLKRQDGQADAVLRADLDELATSGRSLMPEGLENDLKPAELADVIAFIDRGEGRPKELEGNRPALVVQRPDGSIRLEASSAEVHGPTLIYETTFGNLGYWHAPADHASWSFRIDRPGTFTVSMEWACADESAGNHYVINVDAASIHGEVGATGSWSTYRSMFLQELTLGAGVHRLRMRPAGPIHGALADVRAILFTPRTDGRRASKPEAKPNVEALAQRILDRTTPDAEREAIIREHSGLSDALVAALAQGLGPDRAEEYRRIPWIWRVAIAAGRRNHAPELRRLFARALPDESAPLDHWRAVVLGGGLINGITQAGAWPGERIESLIGDDAALASRWRRTLALASRMADDESVPPGTRYDALRIVGLEPWDRRGAQLFRYLAKGVNAELQQGAICALGDMPSPYVPQALLSGWDHYNKGNRTFVLEALGRDDFRREALLDALEAGRLTRADVGDELKQLLLDPSRNRSYERARKLLEH